MPDPAPRVVPLPRCDGPAAAPGPERPARRGGWIPWLLLALAIFGALFLGARVGSLGERVVALEGALGGARAELAAARGALEAWEWHRQEVRASVGDLRARMDQLDALVGAGPAPRDPAAPAPSPPPAP